MGTWRKTYGAIKDTTSLNLAKVNSEFKDLDIAIVKATSHVECLPKERYVRRLFVATSLSRPRSEVNYCIYALTRRLNKTHNWMVSLKTLIVIHRMLREGDPTFIEEIMNYSQRGHILLISNSKDDSSPLAWDCSVWIRNYALFLEERLECYRVLKYDIGSERLLKNKEGGTKGHSKTRILCCPDLLEHMPALQNLLFRLINCKPEGQACGNFLVQHALALVLKESFKIYCAINDGIINLVDMFFDMSKLDAVKAFEIYKRSGEQEYDQNNIQTNEEEEKAIPQEKQDLTEEVVERSMPQENEESQPPEISQTEPEPGPEPEPATTGDLLGLESDVNPMAAEIEQSNALALAILQPGSTP